MTAIQKTVLSPSRITTSEFIARLKRLRACDEALEYVASQPDAKTAWLLCPDIEWVQWLTEELDLPREVTMPAWKAFEETTAPAWKVYQETRETAWKVYQEMVASAGKAFEETTAPAARACAASISWEVIEAAILKAPSPP
jgi:hypothetical protein